MPRPLRLEFEDAWYHVMNRGAGYRKIYKVDEHRNIFLEILEQANKLFGAEFHAYCLMDNHYHLLVRTPRGNLSRIMRHVNGLYTQQFNKLMKTDGPLFRGRYKAILIEQDEYLPEVSRYIHLNPVTARIVKSPTMYKWSSYRYYLGKEKKPKWFFIDEVMLMLSEKQNTDTYKRFVEQGLDAEIRDFYQKGNTPAILGKKEFKEKLLKKLSKNEIEVSLTDYNKTREVPSLEQVDIICAKSFKINEISLYRKHRGMKNEARKIAIYFGRLLASERLSVLAKRYQCSNSNISNIVKEMENRLKTDKKLKTQLESIRKMLAETCVK